MAETVYHVLPAMQSVDVLYGLALLALAVLALVVRSKLANFKAIGPKLYLLLLTVSVFLSILYTIMVAVIISGSAMSGNYNPDYTSLITSVITSGIMITCNVVYFKKRSHLFEY